MAKKKVKLKISRDETWYPEIEVDDHLTDEEKFNIEIKTDPYLINHSQT